MPKKSAGLLMYRRQEGGLEVFLVHLGGPYWKNKDLGAWSVPKGEYRNDEEPLDAARREFNEETGLLAEGPFAPLKPVRQSIDKHVTAWACQGDCDPARIRSNTFTQEWPPHSGQRREFPEVDRAAWFLMPEARERIIKGQLPLLDELERLLA